MSIAGKIGGETEDETEDALGGETDGKSDGELAGKASAAGRSRRPRPRRRTPLAALAAGLALAGCAGAPRSGETLLESVRTYNDGIRWQRFAAAAGRLPAAERSAFVDEWDARADDLKVADYEIVDLVARGDVAQVQVKISWYGEREGTLHDTHARQIWRRAGKIWLLTDEVRMRGAAMPGLAEPAPAPLEGATGGELDGDGDGEAAGGGDRDGGGDAAVPAEASHASGGAPSGAANGAASGAAKGVSN